MLKNPTEARTEVKQKIDFSRLTVSDNPVFPLIFAGELEGLETVLNPILKYFSLSEVRVKEVLIEHKICRFDGTHDVTLDLLAQTTEGNLINIEFQSKHGSDLQPRSAPYAAEISSTFLKKGMKYKDLPGRLVIFFCKFDPWGFGAPGYIARRKLEFQGRTIPFDDREVIIFLNGTYPYYDEIGKILQDLNRSLDGKFNNAFLAKKSAFLLKTEEGKKKMSTELERILAEREAKGKAEGRVEGKAEGVEEGKILGNAEMLIQVIGTLKNNGSSWEFIRQNILVPPVLLPEVLKIYPEFGRA